MNRSYFLHTVTKTKKNLWIDEGYNYWIIHLSYRTWHFLFIFNSKESENVIFIYLWKNSSDTYETFHFHKHFFKYPLKNGHWHRAVNIIHLNASKKWKIECFYLCNYRKKFSTWLRYRAPINISSYDKFQFVSKVVCLHEFLQ